MTFRALSMSLLAAAAGFAADTELAAPAKNQAIYFHPIMTLITTQVAELPTTLYLTYEREIAEDRSFVVQPAVLFGQVEGSSSSNIVPKTDLFGVQAMFAVHNFFNGKVCDGMYWAPEMQLMYESASRAAYNSGYYSVSSEKASVVAVSLLGMIGYRAKWESSTLFADVGLGRTFASISGDKSTDGVSASGLTIDLNFGVGIPF